MFVIGAVQFVNVLDFLMVMHLGPDFARALELPESDLAYLAAAYTWAGGAAGLIGAGVLDRFDRRVALAVTLTGLAVATALGGLAPGPRTLIAARVAAGFFGGPATSVAISIVADVVPSSRRGRAMGAVAGAGSLASVAGVPAGLLLAEHLGWRAPFFAVAALGLLAMVGAVWLLPPLKGHLAPGPVRAGTLALLSRPLVRTSYAMTALVMMAGFLLIPNLSAYVQGNLGYPRDRLEVLFLVAGVGSFVTMRLGGRWVDRFGSFRVGTAGAAGLCAVVSLFFIAPLPGVPVLVPFVAFYVALALRNVAYNTLATRVPAPSERARFQSLQSTIQHVATALATSLAPQLLRAGPALRSEGRPRLEGMDRVALISLALTAVLPWLLHRVEGGVRRREERELQAVGVKPG